MTFNSIWKFLDDSDTDGYTLVIPSVAVANLGQLACDLVVSSLAMQKFASIYSPALIPVLGYDPYDLNSHDLSSCCEVFKCPSKKIAVLQFRAPLVYKYARDFLQDVVSNFKERAVKDIVILTSSFAHEKKHISSSSFRYIANDISPYKEKIRTLNWMEYETMDGSLKIYGGGFASLLYNIAEEYKIPCTILFKYCSEGDNVPDAYEMVNYLHSILPLFKDDSNLISQLVPPVSWKLLFGRPPPEEIY